LFPVYGLEVISLTIDVYFLALMQVIETLSTIVPGSRPGQALYPYLEQRGFTDERINRRENWRG
jgi:hypothetical protein